MVGAYSTSATARLIVFAPSVETFLVSSNIRMEPATTRPDSCCMPAAAQVTATSPKVMKRRLSTLRPRGSTPPLRKETGTFFQHIRLC